MEILRLLSGSSSHGYQMHKDLGVTTSTIYQHLNELEEAGMVESVSVSDDPRDRTEYHITTKGEKLLELLGEED